MAVYIGKTELKKAIGYLLLAPAIISVFIFIIDLFGGEIFKRVYMFSAWTGDYGGDAGGFTSALPFYFGLMAIAGAILLFDSKKE